MGEVVRLTAASGPFDAWIEPAREARRGGLVILPAVWDVTPHLRAVAAEWAGAGWQAIVPALLDPGGSPFPIHDLEPARLSPRLALAEASGQGEAVTPRVQAAVDALEPPVMVMGFCFGGTAAWLAACRGERIAAVSAFYGGHIARFAAETPTCPTLLHFGRRDALISAADVEAIAARHPDLPIHLYDAGHAFVAPNGFHADSARLAMLRTRALFHRASGGREHGA